MNFYNDNPVLKYYLSHPLLKRIIALKERDYSEAATFNYAPADYDEAIKGYEQILELAGDICAEIILGNAEEIDKAGSHIENNEVIYAPGTNVNLKAMRQAGLMGVSMPRRYEGLNVPKSIFTLMQEMVCRADAGFGNLWGLQDCAETILAFATEEQRRRFLPRVCAGETMSMDLTEPDAGSDLQSVRLKATYSSEDDCWYLDGVKRFITNGDADIHLVLARSEDGSHDARGLSLFIYEKKSGGMSIRRIEEKMGIHGSPTCEIVYSHARAELCGSRKLGLIKYVMALMNGARLGIATQSVGLAQAAYNEALAYAKDRKQFGMEIINIPAVYEMLSTMDAKIFGCRALLHETARSVDMYSTYDEIAHERTLTPEERREAKYYSRRADSLTPLVKGMGSEIANQNAYDSIQVHGGSGYMRDYPCERIYRDARITSIYEGTTQLQVVAAIRYVTNGYYNEVISEYLDRPVTECLQPLHQRLVKLSERYAASVARVQSFESPEAIDFLSRRMVEMAAYTIMGSLLLGDANADAELFGDAAHRFVAFAESLVAGHEAFISSFTPSSLNHYRK